MAISNDWQNVPLNKISIQDVTETYRATIYDRESVERIASVMGWECIPISQTFKIKYYTAENWDEYPANAIYAIRPIDQADNYGLAVIPAFITESSRGYNCVFAVVSLSNGYCVTYVSYDYTAIDSNVMILRPSATGCMGIKFFINGNTQVRLCLDNFLNPKTGNVKWGVISSAYIYTPSEFSNKYFMDLYTGAIIGITASSGSQYAIITPSSNFYPYVALKKMVVITTEGIYIARTAYTSYIDYNEGERTIELDGDMYRALGTFRLYIPLN